MLDPNLLRNNFDWVVKQLARKNFVFNIDTFRKKYYLYKTLQKKTEYFRTMRKNQAKIISYSKQRGEDISIFHQEASIIKNKLMSAQLEYNAIRKEIKQYELSFPNIPDSQIPNGIGDQNNLEIMRWGIPIKSNFPLRDHIELGKLTNGFNLSKATQLMGSRFVVLRGQIAQLHRALTQFMLDFHIKHHGYEEYYLPYLANHHSLYGAGQLPKFYSDLFHIHSEQIISDIKYALIPTAEVPLVNLMRDVIINKEILPIKMIAHTPCFRAEAGTYGYRNRGLIRTHQFDKVEIVQIVHPKQSMQALEDITMHAEQILKSLQLPYRKMLLCAGNIGFSACKTYDLEVWLPSFNDYCEIASCSNVGDFQARRIQARYRSRMHKKIKLLHTLNASGLAVGRTLAAIMENFQLDDGSIVIPLVLRPYMHGLTHIRRVIF